MSRLLPMARPYTGPRKQRWNWSATGSNARSSIYARCNRGDEATVLASLGKTHRLVIVHEAVEAFGIGAEIAARMADIGFDELDAPIRRIGAPYTPVPYSPALESEYAPSAAKLATVVKEITQ